MTTTAPFATRLHFCDHVPQVAEALRRAFEPHPEVVVRHADLFAYAEGAVLSAANGFGFMDGGVDLRISTHFGDALARRVYDTIHRLPGEQLEVGQAIVVPTGHPKITHLVVAPTMAMPEPVPAANAYRALRAALRVASRERIPVLWSPGLATGTGRVAPDEAAREMVEAYRDFLRAAA